MTNALRLDAENAVEGLGTGAGETNHTPRLVPLQPACGLHSSKQRRAECTAEVVALLAPVDTEPQQRPCPRSQTRDIDAQGGEDRLGPRPQSVGMRRNRCGERITVDPSGADNTIGADESPSIQQ